MSLLYNKSMRESPPKYLLLWQTNWLKAQYEKNKLSTYQIAEIVGCSERNVRYVLRRLGLKSRKYTMSPMALQARMKGGSMSKPKKGKGEGNADERDASKNTVND
jgi:hypothetical protein